MKNRFDLTARTALAISLAAIAGAALAVPGYVTSGSDTAVLSGSGSCWKTGDWTPDKARGGEAGRRDPRQGARAWRPRAEGRAAGPGGAAPAPGAAASRCRRAGRA